VLADLRQFPAQKTEGQTDRRVAALSANDKPVATFACVIRAVVPSVGLARTDHRVRFVVQGVMTPTRINEFRCSRHPFIRVPHSATRPSQCARNEPHAAHLPIVDRPPSRTRPLNVRRNASCSAGEGECQSSPDGRVAATTNLSAAPTALSPRVRVPINESINRIGFGPSATPVARQVSTTTKPRSWPFWLASRRIQPNRSAETNLPEQRLVWNSFGSRDCFT